MDKIKKAINSWIKMLERKHNVKIKQEANYYVAYQIYKNGEPKEICKEKDLCELDITLKYYLS